MLAFLPGPVRGATALLLYTVNTVCIFTLMIPFVIIKAVIPAEGVRHPLTRILTNIVWAWIHIDSFILRLTQDIKIDAQGLEGFSQDRSYLVISNHRSWADILILQHLWRRRIPFLKFFIKKELIWVPLLGIAWWALDFPFMKRYSKEFIKKHPELKGKDIETTRKYCEKFKRSPIAAINFMEGTRFDEHKRDKQQSQYKHLLKPRAGGAAVVLSAMGESLDAIIDVTIVYPKNSTPLPFWSFLRGDIPEVVVRARRLEIPSEFVGRNYEQDTDFRDQFLTWTNALWDEKDRRIDQILKEHQPQNHAP